MNLTNKLKNYIIFIPFFIMYIYILTVNTSLFILLLQILVLIMSLALYLFALIYRNIKNTKLLQIIGFGLFFSGFTAFMFSLYLEDFSIMTSLDYGKAAQFLAVSNLIFIITYLFAFLFINNKFNHTFYIFIMFILFNALVMVAFLGILPSLYTPTTGFTIFKTYIDYITVLALFLVLVLLVIHKDKFDKAVYTHQLIAISVYILSEVLILFQINRFGFLFLLSLFLKALVYLILVRAFIGELLLKKISVDYETLSDTILKLKSQMIESQRNENIFKTLYDDAPLGYQSLDTNGKFLYVNETYSKMLGYKKEEMIGHYFGDFMDEDSNVELIQGFLGFKKRGTIDIIFNMIHKKGYNVPVRFIGKIAYKEEGEFKQTHCILMDITNELEYQKGIVESKNKLDNIIDALDLSIYIINTNFECTYVNDKLLEETGYSETDLIGKNLHGIIHHSYASGDPYPIEECVVYKSLKHKYPYSNIKEIMWAKDNSIIEVVVTTRKIMENGVLTGIMVTMRNASQAQNIMQSLIRMSYHDSLTGIFNRRYYQDELLNMDVESNLPLSVIVSDINGLKLINDAFGHSFGDTLLKNAVEVFTTFATNLDMLARIGGDEFVIVMPKTTKEEAQKRIENMNKEASKYTINSIELSISYGTATKILPNQSFEDLYTKAEDEMYRDKLINVPAMRSTAIDRIISTLHKIDPYAKSHAESVSAISVLLAEKLGYKQEFLTEIKLAGMLHDIGKIILPPTLLDQNHQITKAVFEEYKKHSEIGFRILNSSSQVRMLSQYVLSHHEHVDGSGYPQGLKGNKIPIQSRIIGLAEALDVMMSKNSYHKLPKSKEEVIADLQEQSAKQFDPAITSVAIEYIDKIEVIIQSKEKSD